MSKTDPITWLARPKIILSIFVVVFLIWILSPILLVILPNPWPNQNWAANLAPFADSFGAINSLFSGLAFAAVFAALIYQAQGLRQQEQELKDTRLQFAKSVRLSALELMVSECNRELNELDRIAREGGWKPLEHSQLQNSYIQKRRVLVSEIETILSSDTTPENGEFAKKYKEIINKFAAKDD